MIRRLCRLAVLYAALLLIGSCSSSGDNSVAGGGIGGTGVTSGSISAFGSIFVNGRELNLSGASIAIDDQPSTEADLRLGMVVTAIVDFNADGTIARTTSVKANDDVEGPIANVPLADPSGLTKTFSVLKATVIVDSGNTVFDGGNAFPSFAFETVAQNDIVEVHGFFDENDVLHATYVRKNGVFTSGTAIGVEVKGKIKGIDVSAETFTIRALTVHFDATTDLSGVPGGLSNNLFVQVTGTVQWDGSVLATKIELRKFDQNGDVFSVEGIVDQFVNNGNFVLNTTNGPVPVDASMATFEPTTLTLADGRAVEVEGILNNGTLIASKVRPADAGAIRIEARVFSTDVPGGVLTLEVTPGHTVPVLINAQTVMIDKRDKVKPFNLSNIVIPDFVRVHARQDKVGNLIAVIVQRDQPDDVIVLAPLQAALGSDDTGTLRMLGVDFTVTNGITEFEDFNGNPLAGDFFTQITTGSRLKVKDRDDSAPPSNDGLGNGVADTVQLED